MGGGRTHRGTQGAAPTQRHVAHVHRFGAGEQIDAGAPKELSLPGAQESTTVPAAFPHTDRSCVHFACRLSTSASDKIIATLAPHHRSVSCVAHGHLRAWRCDLAWTLPVQTAPNPRCKNTN